MNEIIGNPEQGISHLPCGLGCWEYGLEGWESDGWTLGDGSWFLGTGRLLPDIQNPSVN